MDLAPAVLRGLSGNLPRLTAVTSPEGGPVPQTDPGVGPDGRLLTRRSVSALAVAGVLFFVPLLFFVLLARGVAEQEILSFDRPVMLWLHSVSTSWLTAMMQAVTDLGGLVVVPVAAIAVAVTMWRRGLRRKAVFLAAAVIGSTLLNAALKALFQRARPDYWEHLVAENSYSFPSGHAMASMSLAAALIVVAWRTRWRWATVTTGAVYVVAVGVSRMYLGVHYPSDVLAGWAVAALWVVVVLAVLDRVQRWHRRRAGGGGFRCQ